MVHKFDYVAYELKIIDKIHNGSFNRILAPPLCELAFVLMLVPERGLEPPQPNGY